MKRGIIPLLVTVAISPTAGIAADTVDPLCAPLQTFAMTLKPKETKALTFHTIWGQFKDEKEETFRAARCFHSGYAQAQEVCDVLMKTGAREFSFINVKRAIRCLSPQTVFAPELKIRESKFELDYGDDDRGSIVTLKFYEDTKIGGWALSISATGT